MTTAFVNVFYDGDGSNEHDCTLMVQHAGNRNFNKEYDKALKKVKSLNPESWGVDEVWRIMQAQGWRIERVDCLEISY